MTTTQVAYWDLQERKRANQAQEAETNRSNVARETETNRSNTTKEQETQRANLINESLKAKQVANETKLATSKVMLEPINTVANVIKAFSGPLTAFFK